MTNEPELQTDPLTDPFMEDESAAPAAGTSTGPREFEHKIEGAPDFSRVSITLPAGQGIKAEASVMISMDTNIAMTTKLKGGFKRFLARESLFINEFRAEQFPGEISFASGLPGDLRHYYLDGQTNKVIYLQSGSFLAAGLNVDVQTKWQGMIKGFFSGAGLFLVRCEGKGDVYFNSYGGIIEIDVTGQYTIDTKHIVAFTEGLDYNVRKFAGYKSFFFSGEGLVADFKGHGKVWVQTRNVPAFAAWVYPFRPKRNSD